MGNNLQRKAAEIAGMEALLSDMPDDPLAKPLLKSRIEDEKKALDRMEHEFINDIRRLYLPD